MRLALIPLVLCIPAFADGISVGVKAGVPLTDVLKTAGEIGGQRFEASRSNYTVGPMLNVRLPFGLAVEVAAMYKKFEQQAGQIEGTLSVPYRKNGRSWEFPVVGQYRFTSEGTLQPYVEAGFAFNRLTGVLAPFRSLPASLLKPEAGSETRAGFVTGIGVEMHLPIIRITPGLRFTRYGETQPWLPPANAVDFLVGFTF